MNTLHLTDEQLSLVQRALDFYSRIGIGQFREIKDHPTFEKHLYKEFSKNGPLEVGDSTQRGEVVEIGEDFIKTKGSWGNGEEVKTWHDVENIHHSTDYSKYHEARDCIDAALVQPRNMLYRETMSQHGSWGIHHPNVDDSCRMAFDIIQVIRHEKWKRDPKRSNIAVDSHISFTHRKDDSSNKIKCELSDERD